MLVEHKRYLYDAFHSVRFLVQTKSYVAKLQYEMPRSARDIQYLTSKARSPLLNTCTRHERLSHRQSQQSSVVTLNIEQSHSNEKVETTRNETIRASVSWNVGLVVAYSSHDGPVGNLPCVFPRTGWLSRLRDYHTATPAE